ncbi:MAG: glycine zipper domain-containing protein [Candidatus Dormibacteria bacterium]
MAAQARRPNEEARLIGAGIGGAAGGVIGAIVGGPVGAGVGGAIGGWLGHVITTELSKGQPTK